MNLSRFHRQPGTRSGATIACGRVVTDVSGRLRAARERAGLTIEDISASTRIGVSALRAIERGDFAKLPGDFYVRAFLRTYARELQLSPDAITEEYDASRQPADAGEPIPKPEPVRPPPEHAPLAFHFPRVPAIAVNAVVVIALVAVLAAVFARSRSTATRPPEPGAVATSGTAAPAPATSAGNPAPQAPPEKLVIEIQAAAPTWVTGAADGKRVIYQLLAPGERVKVDALNELSFRVGNAGAFTYSINGVAGKPIGGPGEVRDFQITRENYRSFRR